MPRWHNLTTRGKAMLLVGLALTVVSAIFGLQGVLPWTLLLVSLPLFALFTTRINPQISTSREVVPLRTQRGHPASVKLELYSKGLSPGVIRFADNVPNRLGPIPRFEAHRMFRWHRVVTYDLPARHRGGYELGPLGIQIADLLGLATTYRAFEAKSEVLVTPRVVRLPSVRLAAGSGTTGEESPQQIAVSGHDDVLVREHRHGDDLRRVHWRSSAKLGKLMVRREEQSWDPSVCVLLDSRARVYEDDDSFEWAVDAAASASLHLVERGFRVSLVTADGKVELPAQQDSVMQSEAIVLALTQLEASPRSSLKHAISQLPAATRPQTMIAILGAVGKDDVARLARGISTSSKVTAFHLNGGSSSLAAAVPSWRIVPVTASSQFAKAWGS